MTLEALALQGNSTVYDTLAATVAPRIRDIRKEFIKESLCDFQHTEHRLEHVANIHGIEFINDSRSSNVNSTWFALESMNKPVIWIAGGVDRNNDYSQLMELVTKRVKAIVCLGLDNRNLHKAFGHLEIPMADVISMDEALHAAYYFGEKGDVALLSPACASFDLFENYEDRGKAFRSSVKNL
ncbi:MAG: cyanophycin synthetase [bacterium]